MCFFNDNRDNADNGLSATRTELGWRGMLYGFMDYAERDDLHDLRDFVSEASRRKKRRIERIWRIATAGQFLANYSKGDRGLSESQL